MYTVRRFLGEGGLWLLGLLPCWCGWPRVAGVWCGWRDLERPDWRLDAGAQRAVFVTTRTMPAGAPYSVGRLGQSASAIGAAGGNCRLEPLNRKRPMHGVGLFHGVSSSCVFRVLGFVDINSQTLAIRGISIPSTLFVESELHCSVQWNQTDRRAGRVPALTLGRRPGP